jgi:hypothetical protein
VCVLLLGRFFFFWAYVAVFFLASFQVCLSCLSVLLMLTQLTRYVCVCVRGEGNLYFVWSIQRKAGKRMYERCYVFVLFAVLCFVFFLCFLVGNASPLHLSVSVRGVHVCVCVCACVYLSTPLFSLPPIYTKKKKARRRGSVTFCELVRFFPLFFFYTSRLPLFAQISTFLPFVFSILPPPCLSAHQPYLKKTK